jgi:hypothetical protein
MTTYATQGWDIVGAIDQRSLNAELDILYNNGGLPKHLEASITKFIIGTLSADIERPTANLGGVTQGIAKLTFRISKGTLTSGKDKNIDLAGTFFTVSAAVNQVELHTDDGQQLVRIYLDFLSDDMAITIIAGGGPLEKDKDAMDVLDLLLKRALRLLEKGAYYLGTVDRSALDIPDFLFPRLVAFTLVPHPLISDLNELLIMLQTIGPSGQRNYNDTLIPEGQGGVVLLSNERLLANVVGEGLQEAIPTGNFAYAPNDFHLTARATYGDNDLLGAHATVESNAIHVKLNVAAMGRAGGGVNIYVDSDTKIVVTYDAATATFQVTQDTPSPKTSYTLEWWVYLTAALTGGVIGVIIALVIGEVSSLVAVGISEKEIKKAFEGALKPIKWPAGNYVTPTAVNFPESAQMFVVPKA